jgi:hypothetical protein
MELDHVFVWTAPGGGALRERLEAVGLVETYRRAHPGQGTANVCYALENAFVELLWLTDAAEAEAPAIARTGLAARARWRDGEGCRFGVAWRVAPGAAQPVETWDYRPPYLPPGASIPMAVASDDVRLPLVFCSPGTSPPAAWPLERRGALQEAAGLARIEALTLSAEPLWVACGALQRLSAQGLWRWGARRAAPWMGLRLTRPGGEGVWLELDAAPTAAL